MTTAIVYKSKTGNTRLVAQWIFENLENCIYIGEPEDCPEADRYIVGFWTDKGSCSEDIAGFLKSLHGKEIYLFGTAGFGVSEEYFDKILSTVALNVSDDSSVKKLFMCQGKMPMMVRERYEKMLEDSSKAAQAEMLIKNFDMALQHPNDEDKKHLLASLEKIAK